MELAFMFGSAIAVRNESRPRSRTLFEHDVFGKL